LSQSFSVSTEPSYRDKIPEPYNLCEADCLPNHPAANAAQIRMSIDDDAKEVEHFALVPIGGSPHIADRLNVRISSCKKFKNNLVFMNIELR